MRKRSARRLLVPWLLLGVSIWLAFDNAPAFLEEWRLRETPETGTATVVSISGGRPARAIRRMWDDLVWGRGRRVTYRLSTDGRESNDAAFVTHAAAARLRDGGTVGVRYLAGDPAVRRIEGEPGLLLLTFRLLISVAFASLVLYRFRRWTRLPSEAVSPRSALLMGILVCLVVGPVPGDAAPQNPPSSKGASAPFDAGAEYDKGEALAAAGKLREARAVFEAAVKQDPSDGTLVAGLGLLRDAADGRVSGDAVQQIFRGFQHATDGRWKEAHDAVNEALKLSPRYARAYAAKATLHTYQSQYAEAGKASDQALALDPQFAEGFYNRGAIRAEMKQFDAAIADYNRAIALEPSYWYAYRNRGSAYTHKNDMQAAIADYTKALELRPRDVDTLLLRGIVYAALRQWDAAMTDLSAVIAIDPRHAAAYYNRGFCSQERGLVDQAIADYTKAAELDPADPAPFVNRGLLYAGRREYARAIADYDSALKANPEFAMVHFNKGRALELSGRVQEAIAEYRTFLRKEASGDSTFAAEARRLLAALERQGKE